MVSLDGVRAFAGQELPRGVQVPVPYARVDRVGEGPQAQVAFRVPLDPGRGTLQPALPGGLVGVEPALGLIHVIRSRFHATGNRPSQAAGRPMRGA